MPLQHRAARRAGLPSDPSRRHGSARRPERAFGGSWEHGYPSVSHSNGCRARRRFKLSTDEARDTLNRVQIFWQQFAISDADAEVLFEKRNQLEDAGRVDDAALEQRLMILQFFVVLAEQEIGDHKLANLLC